MSWKSSGDTGMPMGRRQRTRAGRAKQAEQEDQQTWAGGGREPMRPDDADEDGNQHSDGAR